MARKACIQVFKASELSDKAKEKAHNWFQELWDTNDSDMITESFKYALAEAGLSQLEPRWSLSYCQGDGVAFYGDINLQELGDKDSKVKEIVAAWQESEDAEINVTVEGKNNHYNHYNHWNSMHVNVEVSTYGSLDDAPYQAIGDRLRVYLTQMLKDLSHRLEKEGYEEIEYRQSMESFLDAAEANGWEFTETGKIWYSKEV